MIKIENYMHVNVIDLTNQLGLIEFQQVGYIVKFLNIFVQIL